MKEDLFWEDDVATVLKGIQNKNSPNAESLIYEFFLNTEALSRRLAYSQNVPPILL